MWWSRVFYLIKVIYAKALYITKSGFSQEVMVLRKALMLIIIVIVFLAGCGKQVQEEIPFEDIPLQEVPGEEIPVEEAEDMGEEGAEPTADENVTEESIGAEPLGFVSGMECVNGRFNFTITNIGEENLSISKVYMHIKAKLFRPICDAEVLGPGESTGCTQSYYTAIIGGAPVKIQAKIGKQLEAYVETVEC